jgi:uncharacterized caspase-like protein
VAVVYIAAHGVQLAYSNFIVLSDGLTFESVPGVVRVLSQSQAKLILLLDICRTNPLAQSSHPTALDAVQVRVSNLDSIDDASPKQVALGPLDAGRLQNFVPPSNVLVMFATTPGNGALDTDASGSPFARALAERIQQKLSLSDVLTNVTKDVEARTHGAQVPSTSGRPLGNDIFLAGEKTTVSPFDVE